MPRFVILHHDDPFPHYDFMLEDDQFLLTWRLNEIPTEKIFIAEQIGNHRKLYLDYEGPLTEGRGSVRRIDWGEFSIAAREEDYISVEIKGLTLQGTMQLDKTGPTAWIGSFQSISRI